jgi:hypothetical protein
MFWPGTAVRMQRLKQKKKGTDVLLNGGYPLAQPSTTPFEYEVEFEFEIEILILLQFTLATRSNSNTGT